jgi:hypothetical protein
MIETWRSKFRTAMAMAMLCRARLLVAWVPFDRWRGSLGAAANEGGSRPFDMPAKAMQLSAHVEWAAVRLPFSTKCLPRVMALSWMLRRQGIGHQVVLAARPAHLRDSADTLHAWVEVDGKKVIGDLPGPWLETLRLGVR